MSYFYCVKWAIFDITGYLYRWNVIKFKFLAIRTWFLYEQILLFCLSCYFFVWEVCYLIFIILSNFREGSNNKWYMLHKFQQFNMCQEFEGVKKWHNCYGRQATRVNTNWWNQETPTSLQEIASCYLALYFDSKCIEMLCIAFFWTVKVYVSFVWWNANDGQWTPALFFLFF